MARDSLLGGVPTCRRSADIHSEKHASLAVPSDAAAKVVGAWVGHGEGDGGVGVGHQLGGLGEVAVSRWQLPHIVHAGSEVKYLSWGRASARVKPGVGIAQWALRHHRMLSHTVTGGVLRGARTCP